MMKMSIFMTRRADLSFEEFSDYWINRRWPLVQTVRPIMDPAGDHPLPDIHQLKTRWRTPAGLLRGDDGR